MNETIDPALLEEVERYEKLQQEIRESVRKHSINDLVEASAVAEKVVAAVLDYPKPPTLEEVLAVIKEEEDELVQTQTTQEPPVAEKAPLPATPVTESELITKSAARITKEAKEAKVDEESFQQPNPALVEKNVTAIQKKLKFLEQAIGKIAATGPGGGAVNLKDLDDVDYVSLKNATNNQILSFNAATSLWVAKNAAAGGSGISLTDLSVSVDVPSGNGNLTYDDNSGVFNFTPANLSPKANVADLTTANVVELNSLYFTNARAIASFTAGSNITIESNGRISSTAIGVVGPTGNTGPRGPGVTVADTPPISPDNGDLWWDDINGQMYIYYINAWVVANSTGTVVPTLRATRLVTASTDTVTASDWYIGVNYTGAVTITLPTGAAGQELVIKDESGNCASNPITISGTIDNDTGGAVLSTNNGGIHMLYRAGWRII